MEEIQKTARLMHRLLLAVCALFVAVWLDDPGGRSPRMALAELEALRRIAWPEITSEDGVLGEVVEVEVSTESSLGVGGQLARRVSRVLPTLERWGRPGPPTEVHLPLTPLDPDPARLAYLSGAGTVAELRSLVREGIGGKSLVLAQSFPDETMEEIDALFARVDLKDVETVNPGLVLEGFSVRVELQPDTVVRSGGEHGWVAQARAEIRLEGPEDTPPLSLYPLPFPVALRETSVVDARAAMRRWLERKYPTESGLLIPPAEPPPDGGDAPVGAAVEGLEAAATAAAVPVSPSTPVSIFPELLYFWGQVKDRVPVEATQLLTDRMNRNRARVSLLGVSLPVRALAIAGPVSCLTLILLFCLNWNWARRGWADPEWETHWVPLAPNNRWFERFWAAVVVGALPACASYLLWRGLYSQYAFAQEVSWGKFAEQSSSLIGLVLSTVAAVVGAWSGLRVLVPKVPSIAEWVGRARGGFRRP